MSAPIFLVITTNGQIWIHRNANFALSLPTGEGTTLATYRINSDAAAQKITTLTGSGNSSASALAVTGTPNGAYGVEIT